MPHKKATDASSIEEERRLCYVGVTRAEEILHISCAPGRKQAISEGCPDSQLKFTTRSKSESKRVEELEGTTPLTSASPTIPPTKMGKKKKATPLPEQKRDISKHCWELSAR